MTRGRDRFAPDAGARQRRGTLPGAKSGCVTAPGAIIPTKVPQLKHVLAYLTWSTPALKQGILAYAREADWNLVYPGQVSGKPRLSQQFDGVILLVGDHEVFDTRAMFKNAKIVDLRGIPTVASDAVVVHDHEQIGRMAADYLFGLGYRHFAGVAFLPEVGSDARLDAYEARIRELGAVSARQYIDRGDYSDSFSPKQLLTLLKKLVKTQGLPLAIYATEDFQADQMVQAAVELDYRIPENIAILGTNNDRAFCEMARVPLSSIDVNLSRMGYEAARLLDRLMDGDADAPRRLAISPLMLEKRRSTENVVCEDKIVAAILVYIREHFAERITAELVIQDIHSSRSVAYERFRKIMGRTIGEEIERVRMENAKSLLTQTDYKLDVVARMSGYLDTSAFCRVFRKANGESPTEFRKRAVAGPM